MADNTPHKLIRNPSETGQSASRLPSIPGSIVEEDEDRNETPSIIRQTGSIARKDYGGLDSEPYMQGLISIGTLDTSDGTVRHKSVQLRANSPPGFQLSPQPQRTQRRPSTGRRTSTRRQLPHRGEQFSVDDDPSEVEVDRSDFPTLKRTPSNARRRPTVQAPTLARVESQEIEEENQQTDVEPEESPQEPPEEIDIAEEDAFDGDDDDEDTLSQAESFTLKDRQLAINATHPFGIRIWKPALYKKNRSVEKNAEEDIHSSPSQIVGGWLSVVNCLWTILFGWWLATFAAIAALICFLLIFEPSAVEYGKVFWGLAGYLFWPFGKFVKLEQDEQYAEEDEGEGRSITEYERWQSGDLEYGRLMFGPSAGHTGSIVGRHRNSIDSASEQDHLLSRSGHQEHTNTGLTPNTKRRLFGRGQWTLGRIVFFGFFYFVIAPQMLLSSLVCWFMVFTIPMGRVLLILFSHLRKRPLALSFHPDISYVRDTTKPSAILLCTYRAAGLKYWKYTVDGTNIFLINFLIVVIFVIADWFLLKEALGIDIWLTSPAFVFVLALVSVIPLAYFIGQAVASISAQSSMGMGAAVNAFFSTIVEVYLYCVALNQGKGALVEGSIIGSIFAGLLLLPGLSMCFGAIKRKTQRFNVKSAGATTTMLLFAIIATFGPTLFYKIYGSHELMCMSCSKSVDSERDCRRCFFRQIPALNDDFFLEAVRPFCWAAAICLFLSYIIGLLFTLRTHAAVIWTTEIDEKKPTHTADVSPLDTRMPSMVASQQLSNGSHMPKTAIRDSQLYTRILGQSLRSVGIAHESHDDHTNRDTSTRESQVAERSARGSLPHLVPPRTPVKEHNFPVVPGLTEEENNNLVQQVAELAATAATIAARDVVHHPRAASYQVSHPAKHDSHRSNKPVASRTHTADGPPGHIAEIAAAAAVATGNEAPGGHDAPNWSRTKSSVILLTATVAYAIIAEILVDTVDIVLESVTIDEKFLGITLFALVPNTTEFLNAISFAMNGNIALSMEIGSAYVLQVCLLQIPALVLFTAIRSPSINPADLLGHTFNLIFPQWDMVTVILCVFLLSHVYGEGKSNYFKGSILVLTYLVVIIGFWFSGYNRMDIMGVDPSDTLAIMVGGWTRQESGLQAGSGLPKKSEL